MTWWCSATGEPWTWAWKAYPGVWLFLAVLAFAYWRGVLRGPEAPARKIAMDAGLRYVYTGNVHDKAGDTTYCPGCGKAVIERDWYEIGGYALDGEGRCRRCSTPIAGRFGAFGQPFGRRRIPVRIG